MITMCRKTGFAMLIRKPHWLTFVAIRHLKLVYISKAERGFTFGVGRLCIDYFFQVQDIFI